MEPKIPLVEAPIPDLGFDSRDYAILYSAALHTCQFGGLTCELGVRQGGSTELILRASMTRRPSRPHIAVDPYGSLPYAFGKSVIDNPGYSDEMRREAAAGIHRFAADNAVDVFLFPMKDTDFFQLFENGIPLYLKPFSQTLWNEYSLVHIDAQHETQAVLTQAQWFIPRMLRGGMMVFDDVNGYDHAPVDEYLLHHGYEIALSEGRKIAYSYKG